MPTSNDPHGRVYRLSAGVTVLRFIAGAGSGLRTGTGEVIPLAGWVQLSRAPDTPCALRLVTVVAGPVRTEAASWLLPDDLLGGELDCPAVSRRDDRASGWTWLTLPHRDGRVLLHLPTARLVEFAATCPVPAPLDWDAAARLLGA